MCEPTAGPSEQEVGTVDMLARPLQHRALEFLSGPAEPTTTRSPRMARAGGPICRGFLPSRMKRLLASITLAVALGACGGQANEAPKSHAGHDHGSEKKGVPTPTDGWVKIGEREYERVRRCADAPEKPYCPKDGFVIERRTGDGDPNLLEETR